MRNILQIKLQTKSLFYFSQKNNFVFAIQIFLLVLFFSFCTPPFSKNQMAQAQSPQKNIAKFQNGLDVLLTQKKHLIKNKKIALIVNQTSRTSDGKLHAIEAVTKILDKTSQLVYVYAPEHGLLGKQQAGKKLNTTIETPLAKKFPKTTFINLYGGKFSAPSIQQLQKVDLIVYDIQDTSDRAYTYISTLYKILAVAASAKTGVMVLDRPLLNKDQGISGPLLLLPWSSFVGIAPLPMHYSMTVGELARLLNEEKFFQKSLNAKLTVLPMQGYKRDMTFQETHSAWVSPSPNIADVQTAKIYSGMVLLEGTNLSEGRGTPQPFLTVGAPYIKPNELLQTIPQSVKENFTFKEISFVPSADYRARQPKYLGKTCQGLSVSFDTDISSTDINEAQVLELTLAFLWANAWLYPNKFTTRKFLDNLWGSEILRMALEQTRTEKIDYKEFREKIFFENKTFKKVKEKYLLYGTR